MDIASEGREAQRAFPNSEIVVANHSTDALRELNELKVGRPFLLERVSQQLHRSAWNIGCASQMIRSSPMMFELRQRLRSTADSDVDRAFSSRHIVGAALATYVFASLPRAFRETSLAIELACKTTLGVAIIDHHVDAGDGDLDYKRELINGFLSGIPRGSNLKLSGHLALANELALEVYQTLEDAPRFQLFHNEARSLARAAIRHLEKGERSLAESVQIGGYSFGLLAAIPMALDSSIPSRFLKAAKHFGAMVEVADESSR